MQSEDLKTSKLQALLFELKGYQFGGELLQFDEVFRCCENDERAGATLMSTKLRVPQTAETYYQQKYSTPESRFL
jgi:hypothetical protein